MPGFNFTEKWRIRVKNKFFTQRVCVCALLATNIGYAQKAAQK